MASETVIAPWDIEMALSEKVVRQKRVVYDIFMMFGDVGGLNDFLFLFFGTLFGYFSEDLLLAKMVKKMLYIIKG